MTEERVMTIGNNAWAIVLAGGEGSTQPTRTLPRRPRLASCSLNLPLFSAELADNPSDRPQDLIR
jgi:hypothetical protein